jgi:cohesin complex subunit SA-1/2
MACRDMELNVRVAVVQVLSTIDSHGLLDEDEREQLCLLVFDEEAKVRKAVSGFVQGVWGDAVEERLVGRKPTKQEKDRVGAKVFGMLLVKWGKALDKQEVEAESQADDSQGQSDVDAAATTMKEAAILVGSEHYSRVSLAVEALWEDIEPASDWEALLDLLLLDHSATDRDAPLSSRGRNKKPQHKDGTLDEVWRLEDIEESMLLQVLVSSIKKVREDASGSKNVSLISPYIYYLLIKMSTKDEGVVDEVTRALIKALPNMFVKYQTDENRIVQVLRIPQLMKVEIYLDMRMIAVRLLSTRFRMKFDHAL